jgi:mRNA-degrading endonuclease RelE of RelBE toxin-antitoxin system
LSETDSTIPDARQQKWMKIFPSCHPPAIRANGRGVFQVIFNKISAAEMASLPKDLQLDLLSEFHFFPEDLGAFDKEGFGRVTREGRTLHRYRAKEYRIYFERHPEGLLIHRVLHKNTIRDFLFRSNLPLDDEDGGLAGTKDFWQLIHEAEESRK